MDRDMDAPDSLSGLYIHLPFCRSRCSYCDYGSEVGLQEQIPAYLAAVGREMSLRNASIPWTVIFVYVGGGTPSLIGPAGLDFLMTACRENFSIDERAEISIEVNPENTTPDFLKTALGNGFNRISIGVQTLNAYLLDVLGRSHTPQEAREAFLTASGLGFRNISVDLLYGVPAQTSWDFLEGLREVIGWGVQHISLFSLTVVPGSTFHQQYTDKELALPDEDEVVTMYYEATRDLQEAGFEQYDLCNFARPGYVSLYNENHLRCGPYLGLGAKAHSHFEGVRFHNEPDVREYIRILNSGEGLPSLVRGLTKISPERYQQESLLLGLRRTRGIDIERFDARFNTSLLERYYEQIQNLAHAGLIEFEGGRLRLSSKGFLHSSAVFREFL